MLCLGQPQRLAAIVGHDDLVAVVLEVIFEQVGDGLLVVYDENLVAHSY